MSRTAGIDVAGDQCRIAVVDHQDGRPQIESLSLCEADGINQLMNGVDIVKVAIDDQKAIVKRLRSPGGDGQEALDRLMFELAQSLLDDISAFQVVFQPTADRDVVIGAAVRQSLLQTLPDLGERETVPQLRSVALGRGFTAFCRRAEGALVALAEIGRSDATICLLHGREIADVATLEHTCEDLTVAAQQERLAIDLKTVINYRQSALLDQGLSQPLSGLLLAGGSVTEACRAVIQRYFPVGVSVPELNSGYVKASSELDPTDAEIQQYLVSLGLAVN